MYKRRLTLPETEVMACFQSGAPLPVHSQIGDEIQYFREYYGALKPAVFLSYEREAFYALDGSDLRITFDENILFRQEDLSLEKGIYGTPVLGSNQSLMEIKTSSGLPLWLSHALNREKLFKTSFSKYGSAYRYMLSDKSSGRRLYA